MDVPRKSGKEKIVYQSREFEVIKQPMKIGNKKFEVEIARRSPGVRLLILKDKKILLTREFRTELNGYDYRLPGGKVFESIKEYHSALEKKEDILNHAIDATKKECAEETGLDPLKLKHIYTSTAGLTVIWDLFYFLVSEFKVQKQNLGTGEVIIPEWYSFKDVKNMCLNGNIKEDRTVAALLRFLKNY